MRSACTISVTCALLLGFFEAPFAHIHEHTFGEGHHAAEQTHVHVLHSARQTAGLAFDQIDPADDERLVNSFQTVQQRAILLFFTPEPSDVVAPVSEGDFVRAAPSICSHDPPATSATPSRAPPTIPA